MKILHLIDSLNPGGAERMAVSYVNALVEQGIEAHLWATREEGLLKGTLKPEVHYRFLKRKGPVGLKALFAASSQIKKENIRLIHAHSTSWFFGTLLKWLNPTVKLVWHDHYGSRYLSNKQVNKTLIFCSRYFDRTFAVNRNLVLWHQTHLKQSQNEFIPNFVISKACEFITVSEKNTSKIIVCVANLRKPKNHHLLIHAFANVHKIAPDWSLQLIGKQFPDAYSDSLHELINRYSLHDTVCFLGERGDIFKHLQNTAIGVLSSDMEGLPMTILEYALAGLPVVTTDVGFCREVVQGFGKLVPPGDVEALAKALLEYIQQPQQRRYDAGLLQQHILKHYTETAVIPLVLEHYNELLSKK